MPTVLLIRHGQGSFGAADYDVLSDRGRTQADAVAGELTRRGLRPVVVASGALARQRDTAAPIAAAAGVPVAVDPRWDEYDSADILARHSRTEARLERRPGTADAVPAPREFQRLLDEALHAWIAAGGESPTAEAFPAFAARVRAALTELADGLGSGETAVVCTSGGVLAAICAALLGVPAPAFVAFNRVAVNGSITKVVHGRGGTTLVSFNDHAHLETSGASLVTYR